ncbi:MAG: hypothetical protein CM15mP120_20210 [Pseudomonadota bacterium]|nr:MAG: hypothetical protein CM15mP120_20210 [Pseudomonadota bacterium]
MDVTDLAGEVVNLAWLLATLLDISLLAAAVGVAGGELTAVLPVHAPGGFGTYAAGIVTALLPFAVDTTEPSLLRQILTFCFLPQRWSVAA